MIESTVGEAFLWTAKTVSTAMTTHSNSDTPYEEEKHKLSFLDLPYEIRLQIYHSIHLSSPIRRPQLTPWHSLPSCKTYIVQAISTGDDGDESDPSYETTATTKKQLFPGGLLSPRRPLCRVPTKFAHTCRQIYVESRVIPFHENEFVFLNWFTLGLSSALAFVQDRQPWQRAEMRFMRLELVAQELVSDRAILAEWVQLCGHLSALRGLRLMIYVGGARSYRSLGRTEAERTSNDVVFTEERRIDYMQNLLCERPEWILEGLARLRELRQLELELVDFKWAARKKTEWCAKLRELLEATKGETDVKIVCVERVIMRR